MRASRQGGIPPRGPRVIGIAAIWKRIISAVLEHEWSLQRVVGELRGLRRSLGFEGLVRVDSAPVKRAVSLVLRCPVSGAQSHIVYSGSAADRAWTSVGFGTLVVWPLRPCFYWRTEGSAFLVSTAI